jgi:hypothetical protein
MKRISIVIPCLNEQEVIPVYLQGDGKDYGADERYRV